MQNTPILKDMSLRVRYRLVCLYIDENYFDEEAKISTKNHINVKHSERKTLKR